MGNNTTDVYRPDFNPNKLKELMLYVADKCQSDQHFGATKLNKILFFSDFYAYAMHGKPITGATYRRLDRGPAPKELLKCQAELKASEEAEVIERQIFNFTQKRLVAKRSPTVALFSTEELSIVDFVIEGVLAGKTAAQTSQFSHDDCLGWDIAGDQEEIPYEAVFLSKAAPTPADIRIGQEVARRHGLAR